MTAAEPPTVQQAWAAVMGDVQAIGKNSRNDDQKYMFRGVDAVMNAVGPVLRTHGVHVLPSKLLSVTYRDVRTSRDKPAREVTVQVQYRITGPRGDEMYAEVPGESMDFGDKGTAKAMSVAYRILFLQGLTIPTHEAEPDAGTYERANATGPVVGSDLYQARQAAAGAWAVHYGEPTPDSVAAGFARWPGARGTTFWDAEAGHVRAFAAYLTALPTSDAGSDPASAGDGSPDDVAATGTDPAYRGSKNPDGPMSGRQRGALFAMLGELGLTNQVDQLGWVNRQLKTEYESRTQITAGDADVLITALKAGDVPASSERAE